MSPDPGTGRRAAAARHELRAFPWWLGCGWVLVAGVVWLSLTPAPPQVDLPASDKLGHAGMYLLLTLWFAQLYRRPSHGRWALGFAALGAALELAQGLTGARSPEVLDAAANAMGAALGWALAGTGAGRWLLLLERRLLAGGLKPRPPGRRSRTPGSRPR